MKNVSAEYIASMASPFRNRSEVKIIVDNVEFNTADIASVTQTDDVDPLSRKLPTETLEFSILDTEGRYNPASPSSEWENIDSNAEVSISFGYHIGGGVEWLDEDVYKLTGRPSYDKGIATFRAARNLYHMNELMNDYALASQWDPTANHYLTYQQWASTIAKMFGENIVIDEYLRRTSAAFLPITYAKNALQLLSHACGCALYTESDGTIYTKRLNFERIGAFRDYDRALSQRDVKRGAERIKKSDGVNVSMANIYSYSTVASEQQQIYKGTFETDGVIQRYYIEYALSADISITVNGEAPQSADIRANSATISHGGYEGTLEIIAYGKPVETRIGVHESRSGEGAGTDTQDNSMVTDNYTAAELAGQTAHYLNKRTTFNISTRGNPEIRPMDIVLYTSSFGKKERCLVLKNTTHYNGTLSGEMVLKRLCEISGDAIRLEAPVVTLSKNTISWDPVENAEDYAVYATSSEGSTIMLYQFIKTTVIDLLAAGTILAALGSAPYTIRVIAYPADTNYETSDKSNAVSYTPYEEPDQLAAPVISSEIIQIVTHVSWDAVPNATSYEVLCRGSDTKVGLVETTNTYVDLESRAEQILKSGDGPYAITVRAVADGYNTSEESNAITYNFMRLATPRVSISGDVISWSEINGAAGYVIYATASDGGFGPVGGGTKETSYNLGNYTDDLIAIGESPYSVQVVAVPESAGHLESEYSAAVTYTLSLSAPYITKTVGTITTTVSWNAVENAETYGVYCEGSDGKVGIVETANTFVSLESRADLILKSGDGPYKITVISRAPGFDDSQESNYVTYEFIKLKAPVISISGSVVSWKAVEGAIGYTVYATSDEGNFDFAGAQTTGTSVDLADYVADLSSIGNSPYSIQVVAEPESAGNARSDYSNSVMFSTKLETPEIVYNLVGGRHLISWDLVPNADEYYVHITSSSGGFTSITITSTYFYPNDYYSKITGAGSSPYKIKVRARSENWTSSAYSNVISFSF